ncbi:MFS transporter [Amycolatopsis nigrescens]|uniref:MFS transporter n=1 Tax=Amycolatopsis nigrescens TaxID=381445 RepID=UPI00036AAAB5|nr:MFS transporter [Amycolatopsis nigrescens]
MTAAAAAKTGRGTGRARWGIAGVLGAGMFVNYADRVNLSIAATPMMREFGLTAGQLGMVASAFLWTYTVLQLPVGQLVDRIGVRWINRIAALLWALASFLTAAAGGLGLLLVSRLILGVGEAPTVPAGWKATGYWFPKQERGMCTAIFDGASKVSNVLGVPVMAFLVSGYGWQAAFLFTGVLSLLYAAAFWILYREPKEALADGKLSREEYDYIRDGGAQDEQAETPPVLTGLGYLLRRRKTWGLALGYAAYTYAYYVLLTWLPSYLERQLGMSLLSGGMYTVIPWIVAVTAELLVVGWLMDRWIRRGGGLTRVRRVVLISSMLLSLSITGAAFTTSVPVALAFLSLGAAGLAVSAPAGASIVALIAPEGMTGALGGIVNFAANLLGLSAPIVTGFIVDATGSFSSAFVVTGVVVLAGILCYTLLLGRIEQLPRP